MSDKMSPYRYQELLPAPNSIRLLRLLPSEDETTRVQCKLFDYTLQDLGRRSHPYEALSYVWGNADDTLPICLDDLDFRVTRNLHQALKQLRHQHFERVLWIDAVCINQANIKEKEQQILFMSKIYSQASRVVVWLGEVADNSALVFDRLQGIFDAETHPGFVESDEEPPTFLDKGAIQKAMTCLLERPWFRRIWVLQEVAAARSILITCGPTEIEGYAFCSHLERAMPYYDIANELQSLIHAMAYLVKAAIFRRKQWDKSPRERYPLGQLVDLYRAHDASLRHDKVYALLGMSSHDPNEAALAPDYDLSWQELFERLMGVIFHNITSVQISAHEQTVVIMSDCCILGQVDKADRERLDIRTHTYREEDDKLELVSSCRVWHLQPSSRSIMAGDLICLLRGASRPSIIRKLEHCWTIVRISVNPPDGVFAFLNGSRGASSLKALRERTYRLQLVWKWENEPSQDSDLGTLIDSGPLNRVITAWNNAIMLRQYFSDDRGSDLDMTRNSFEKAVENYRAAATIEDASDRVDSNPYSENHVNITKSHSHREPPWSWPVENCHESAVGYMVRAEKGNTDFEVMCGMPPLFWAAYRGHLEVFERLLHEEADAHAAISRYHAGRNALQWASGGGHARVVERLIWEHADVNAKPPETGGRTALQAAAEAGHIVILDRLLELGADVNAFPSDNNGRTALQAAAGGGHVAIVERLLEHGANLNDIPCTFNGRTALQAAAEGGHVVILDRLLELGAGVNESPSYTNGRTALQAAAEKGHILVVERLLERGADVNADPSSEQGRTALQAAAERGHMAVLERLLECGADVNAIPSYEQGITALQAAAERGHMAVLERLLRAGANVNALHEECNNRTALDLAAGQGHFAVVERLLLEGADVNITARDGTNGEHVR